MKKYFVTVLAALLLGAVCTWAQPRAIGLRTAGMLSYEHTFGGANFLQADLGLTYDGILAHGVFNWMLFEDLADVTNLNLYAGPGVFIGAAEQHFAIGLTAQVGVEYYFDAIPLQLSLDIRPGFGFNGSQFWANGVLYGLIPSLGIRYLF